METGKQSYWKRNLNHDSSTYDDMYAYSGDNKLCKKMYHKVRRQHDKAVIETQLIDVRKP